MKDIIQQHHSFILV